MHMHEQTTPMPSANANAIVSGEDNDEELEVVGGEKPEMRGYHCQWQNTVTPRRAPSAQPGYSLAAAYSLALSLSLEVCTHSARERSERAIDSICRAL
jgi:hypothetical protein